jgi:hypothetical protein
VKLIEQPATRVEIIARPENQVNVGQDKPENLAKNRRQLLSFRGLAESGLQQVGITGC